MADYMCGEIWIGGPVPAALVGELCNSIRHAWVSLEWGDKQYEPLSAAELLESRVDKDGALVLWLCHDQARYGQFEELEEFLREHEIPYDRRSDGKYEFDPLYVEYRPDLGIAEQLTDHSGNPTIRTDGLYKLRAKLDEALVNMHNKHWFEALELLQASKELLDEQLPSLVTPLPEFAIADPAG